jgi:hypothetical protein
VCVYPISSYSYSVLSPSFFAYYHRQYWCRTDTDTDTNTNTNTYTDTDIVTDRKNSDCRLLPFFLIDHAKYDKIISLENNTSYVSTLLIDLKVFGLQLSDDRF